MKKTRLYYSLFVLFIGLQLGVKAQTKVLDFPFDGDATDQSSSGNDGVINGATLVEDRFGVESAYFFDGTDDIISVAHDASYKIQYPLTVSMWVWVVDSTSINQFFTNNNHSTSYYGIVLGTSGSNPGHISLSYGDGSGSGPSDRRTVESSSTLKEQTWQHIACIMRGPTDMDLYIDGVKEAVTYSGSCGPTIIYTTANNATIGHVDRSTSTGRYFHGALDDLAMWDDTLSVADIQALYTPGTMNDLGQLSDYRLYYAFDDAATDSSVFETHGTVVGATPVSDRFGNESAYYFDGVDDLITFPKDTSHQTQYPITVSMWVWMEDATAGNHFFTNNDHASRYYGMILSSQSGSGNLSMSMGDGTGAGSTDRRTAIGSTSLPSKEWIHVVGIMRDVLDMELYVNGVPEVVTYSGTGTNSIVYSTSEGGSIGYADRSAVTGLYLQGAIDEVKYWNLSLSPKLIKELYQPGTTHNLYVFGNSTASGCDSVQNGGQTYTSSTTINDTLLSAGSIDTVNILDITINTANGAVSATATTLTASAGNNSYQWIDCATNTNVAGATSQSFTPSTSGDYKVTVTTSNGCSATSTCNTIQIDPNGINNEFSKIHIYPNPSNGIVRLERISVNPIEVNVYNAMGQLVYSKFNSTTNSTIDLTSFGSGIYMFQLSSLKTDKTSNSISYQQQLIVR